MPAAGRRRGGRERADDVGDHERASQRCAQLAQPRLGEAAGHHERVGLRREPPLPGHEGDAIGGGLGPRAAAVERDPGERVAAVAAHALVTVTKADPDRAHQPVLVQVQHHARAGGACRRQGAPAERGVEVVGVDDARPGPAHGPADVLGIKASTQQARGRTRVSQAGGVACQELGVFPQTRAHQPHEIVDRLLLAAGGAIAMVQKEDHGFGAANAQNVSVPAPQTWGPPETVSHVMSAC